MTSSFHTMGHWARIKHNVMFRRRLPGGGTSWTSDNYSVWMVSAERGTGTQFAIYNCLVACCGRLHIHPL